MTATQGQMGKHQGQFGGRSGRTCGQKPLLRFQREGMGKAGQAGLGMASLNSSSGPWDRGAVLSCVVPGTGVISSGEYWPGCKS